MLIVVLDWVYCMNDVFYVLVFQIEGGGDDGGVGGSVVDGLNGLEQVWFGGVVNDVVDFVIVYQLFVGCCDYCVYWLMGNVVLYEF